MGSDPFSPLFHQSGRSTQPATQSSHPGQEPHKRPREQKPVLVTTDQLILEPDRYVDRFVLLRRVEVIEEIPKGCVIRSRDAKEEGGVDVRLTNWPQDEVPKYQVGDEVEVQGRFVLEEPKDRPGRYIINIKWGTEDFFKVGMVVY